MLKCTIKKKKINKDTETLPFDWMLSNPKFVYAILKLLLEDKIDVENIVDNHFFYCDKNAKLRKAEYYYTHPNGNALYNSKYEVIFPHDKNNSETKSKYIRRLERLKKIILNSEQKLTFIYSSHSSLKAGKFNIDDKEIVEDVYEYLTKIYTLINKYNKNNKMIVFDSILNEDESNLHKNIILYKMSPCNSWNSLLHQILQKHKECFD